MTTETELEKTEYTEKNYPGARAGRGDEFA